jgi:uncharacterized protein (TIGR03437 family)
VLHVLKTTVKNAIHYDGAVPNCHRACGFLVLMLLLCSVATPAATPVALTASLSNVTSPPGSIVQLQVFLDSPTALVSGGAAIDLNPAIFGSVIAADAFSATGDQVGSATVQGLHVDLEFASQTAGLGRLPRLPLFTITAAVLPTAAIGAFTPLTIQAGNTKWMDANGVQYSVNVTSGQFTVGGSLSVGNANISGGLQPAGSLVEIDGTGFSQDTVVSLDGVVLSSTQVVSPQKINVTLASAAVLDFRRVAVQNPGGAEISFYPVLHGNPIGPAKSPSLAGIQPIIPLQLYQAAQVPDGLPIAFLNPEPTASDIRVEIENGPQQNETISQTMISLRPDESYFDLINNSLGLTVVPSAPIRMGAIAGAQFSQVNPIAVPPAGIISTTVSVSMTAFVLENLNYTVGQAPFAGSGFYVLSTGAAVPYTISVSTDSGLKWIVLSGSTGTSCVTSGGFFPSTINCLGGPFVNIDISQLKPGTNRGSLTIMPQGTNPQPLTVSVVMNYYLAPSLSALPSSIDITTEVPISQDISISSSLGVISYAIGSVTTTSGQEWLSATAMGSVTPGGITLAFDPSALTGTFDTGVVSITGNNNSLTIPVSLTKVAPTAPAVSPASLRFSAQVGQSTVAPQGLQTGFGLFAFQIQTSSGGAWLSVQNSNPAVVQVNPTGLPAGVYQGMVTVTQSTLALPTMVPVTLTVWSGNPPLVTSDAATLMFTVPHGMTASKTFNVATGNLALTLSASAASSDGSSWLSVPYQNPNFGILPVTPGPVTVNVDASNLLPGTYAGTVTISAPANSSNMISIPVTLTVTPALPPQPQSGGLPLVSSVLNSASQSTSGVSVGEFLTLFGQNIGPTTPVGVALDTTGKVSTNAGGVQVLFNGVAGPVLYASSTQVNTIVPYEVAGSTSVSVAVLFNGTSVAAGNYLLVGAAPGIFTANSGGVGSGAVLNQDNSLNTPANPATRGSTIQIYATGEGATSPGGISGEVTDSDIKYPVLPVSVSIGGLNASIAYAGSAPGEVSGLLQVNAVVPTGVNPGPAVPVSISVGATVSQKNVTIAVK